MWKTVEHDDAEQAASDFIVRTVYAIRLLMKHQGVTQAELARRLSMSTARVSQLLGDQPNMTLETVSKILQALGERPVVTSEGLEEAKRGELREAAKRRVEASRRAAVSAGHGNWSDNRTIPARMFNLQRPELALELEPDNDEVSSPRLQAVC